MKGISTVIATILMLMITIGLAGTAYLYISGAFTQQTQGIELVDEFCSGGTSAVITFKNSGTNTIGYLSGACADDTTPGVTTCGSIGVRRTSPTTAFPAGQPTGDLATAEPGVLRTLTDTSCTTAGNPRTCVYRLTSPSGRSVVATVGCTG